MINRLGQERSGSVKKARAEMVNAVAVRKRSEGLYVLWKSSKQR